MSEEPIAAWAISHWRGGIYVDTVRKTRNEAIRVFMSQYGLDHKEWDKDRAAGVHKPIKVAVQEHRGR